ncbi:MAG: transporter substrate-binding domain-containing protein [Chloroflexota bacterium]|nr:transporter substrate-binding domain-containing protein [Chloroflexota bacterium]MDE2885125.1 transporter substrate-binding domain-containing protein [Chloroflexota bacterium]
MPPRILPLALALLAVSGVLIVAACEDSATPPAPAACTDGQTLDFAFYAFFEPVSFSADADPASPGFHEHAGYEADLLTALETMDGAGLQFNRIPIVEWPGIWLLPSTPDFDIAGGGITILNSRTRDADGNHVVNFTSGHITFQQSLLVRAADAERYATHDGLTSEARVGTIADTTGESRLLQLTGLANPEGILADGTRIVSGSGTLTADGTDAYRITAAGSSADLEGRERLLPPSPNMPQVVYFKAEMEMIESLADGAIDAVARGAVGNTEVAYSYGGGGVLAVTALDPAVEHGGWTLSTAETALTACLNDKVDYLTNGGAIGYTEWRAEPEAFLKRARAWRSN